MHTNLNGKTHTVKAIAQNSPEKYSAASVGDLLMQKIEHYNSKSQNKYRPFHVGDEITIDALLSMYEHSHTFFFNASATHFTKTLYTLVRAAILLRPEYSTDITGEEDKDEEREEWAGPVTVRLNVDHVGELFFYIELITDYLANMEYESERIGQAVKRYKIESMEKQIEKTK